MKTNNVKLFLYKGHCFSNIQCSRCFEGCALLRTSAYCSCCRCHHRHGSGGGSGGGARKSMIQLGERSWIILLVWYTQETCKTNKMCLNESCSAVWVGKHLCDTFPIKNGLKKGDYLQLCFRIYH